VALERIVKPHILSLEPYEPGKPAEELDRELGIEGSIKLASNENPLGPSPRAVEAVRRAADSVNRYPDGASFELRRRLADDFDVAGEQLVFGCGGDELLELLAKVLLGPGDEVVYAWPSFAMYPIVARGMGAKPVPVPLDATIVLRTFSKILGLAGLRIGFGVADPELADYLQRARHPFNVNRLAEVAALAALDDREHVERTLKGNAEGVDYLTRELRGLGIQVWPTDANFLLAQAGDGVQARLMREGVIVRPLHGFGMPEHVRISIGTPEENERLIKALRRLNEGTA
jgi:histidinol-phosphate/aromatic aminotransferase/cobyric acid decarboxylase-like protein